jgi:hypothetical protein
MPDPKGLIVNRLAVITILLMPVLWSGPALGEAGPVQAFQQLGLFGTWSPHCKREPSADNPRVTWRALMSTSIQCGQWALTGAFTTTME